MDTRQLFWTLWRDLLDTDEGITERGYWSLYELGEKIDPDRLKKESMFVEATDDRFYIPSDDA